MRRPYLGEVRVIEQDKGELARFARFCEVHLRLEDGRPLVVEEFQKRMLRDFFAGTTETVILVPKKNSKSTSAAAVALFHLVTVPDAECVVVAASREQAGILFNQAGGFVRRSEWLKARVKLTMRELRSRGDSGRIRVMAADADTADGTICTLAIVDEGGQLLPRAQAEGVGGLTPKAAGHRLGVGGTAPCQASARPLHVRLPLVRTGQPAGRPGRPRRAAGSGRGG